MSRLAAGPVPRRQRWLLWLPLALVGSAYADVLCGMHRAKTCADCPQGNGASWCNGECHWDHQRDACVGLGERDTTSEEDLYELLGVADNAETADIKRNYRKLSVKYHPDKNPDEAARFNSIRDAYEVLSNADKRVLYDTGGMQAVKDGEQGKAEKGESMEKELEVTLSEFYVGSPRKLELRRRVICRRCRKTRDPVRCKGCSACPPGKKIVHVRQGPFVFQQEQQVPSTEDCKSEVTHLDVAVDPGASVGDRIVFKHMGSQKPGQIPGDVTIVLKQKKERRDDQLGWQRHQNDLRIRMNVTLIEALLGFERTIRHLDGHTVEFNTRSVTRPGQVVRIKDEGMPIKDVPSQAGNLYVTLSVSFPQALTEAQRRELEGVRALQELSRARDEL